MNGAGGIWRSYNDGCVLCESLAVVVAFDGSECAFADLWRVSCDVRVSFPSTRMDMDETYLDHSLLEMFDWEQLSV